MTTATILADTILIIDDAPKVCALVARAISDLPYRILTANSVASAMEIVVNEIDRIRLLVVDFGLPDGNGLDIIGEARRLRPRLPILLMSGYAVGGEVDVEFIFKPFDPEDLLERVEALAR
jgi:DNA-binding response OmpR family regulator